jgi:replicative DNA helicase
MLTLGSFQTVHRHSPLVNSLHDTSFLDTYDEVVPAVPLPWTTLNNVTGGIRPGDLWTIAARYGHGKSWILAAILADLLLAGKNVLFYSLEMPKAQVQTRVHVLLGARLGFDVDHVAMRDRVYDRIQYRKIMASIEEVVHGQLFIQDSGKVTAARVQAEAKSADLTMVDYLGLMYTNTGQPAIGDWRNMATISNQIKEAALATDSRIVCAAQINREGDTKNKMPPRSKTLSQSDAIGQDSDAILMMKRYSHTAMAYTIDKNRHGADGISFFTNYMPNTGQFGEISKDAAEDRRYDEDYTGD